ncbi:hypothetical protein GTQ43_03630 [Nostoc sp. KVJ3]|uniref:hypothetical protein n=1 Tax=Nostoc sp. KVJ3 TaxID=457945 RepID=UPI002238880D|nr:hypothetical protein [Nostoc sp. KVJ3]MCW5312972.1 hypothetical protein [Nostoc sp. KVJ3]
MQYSTKTKFFNKTLSVFMTVLSPVILLTSVQAKEQIPLSETRCLQKSGYQPAHKFSPEIREVTIGNQLFDSIFSLGVKNFSEYKAYIVCRIPVNKQSHNTEFRVKFGIKDDANYETAKKTKVTFFLDGQAVESQILQIGQIATQNLEVSKNNNISIEVTCTQKLYTLDYCPAVEFVEASFF